MNRYLILGAGAIGSVFGGMLAEGGNEVILVGRPAHMDAVNQDGLRIEGLFGTHHVRNVHGAVSLTEVGEVPAPDAVLLTVKSCDTAEAVDRLADSGLVGADTIVVSLQNGLGNVEALAEAFDWKRVLGGRVIFGAEIVRPGSVKVTVWADKVLLGGHDVSKASRLAAEFSRCGIETETAEDISAALWAKVLYNVGLNALSAILEVPYGELVEEKNVRILLEKVIREAYAVASHETGLPWKSEDEYLNYFRERLLPPTASHHSSMLQDIRKGRKTEIESINGEVLRRGEHLGIDTPVNRVIYALVKSKVALHQGT
ncbi:MAG: ketopantoate reductase family protein [Deltaproteobacteria bacterium]|nr:ketopantoate reductase family protein [Deltaproteobacteria bacterium]